MGACPVGYDAIYDQFGNLNHCQLPFTSTPDFLAAQNQEIAVSLNSSAGGYAYAGIAAATPEVQALPQSVQNAIINAGLYSFNQSTYGTKPPAPYDRFISSTGAIDTAGLKAYFLSIAPNTPGNAPSVTYNPITGQYSAAPVNSSLPLTIVPIQQGAIPGDNTSPNIPPPTLTPGGVPADAHPGTQTMGTTLVPLNGNPNALGAPVGPSQQTPILSGSAVPASTLTAWLQTNNGRSTGTVSEWNWILNKLSPGVATPDVSIGYGLYDMITAQDYLNALTAWQQGYTVAPGVTAGGVPVTGANNGANQTKPTNNSLLWPLVFVGAAIALWAILK